MSSVVPIYQDKAWLEEQYETHQSIYKIAQDAGCHPRTIHSWLVRFNIPRTGREEYKHSKEIREKISQSLKGLPSPMLGKMHTKETRERMSKAKKGHKNSNWKGGKTEKIREFRRTKEYVAWVKAILERAGHKCEECGSEEKIEAHHKTSLYEDISKALDIDNGKALCSKCHKEKDWRKKK